MLDLYFTNQFKKDYRKVSKSGEITLLDEVIDLLRQGLSLPEKFRDHALIDSKKFKSQRECHIKPDWLLVYSVNNEKLVLTLTRTGSHSELF